MSALNRTFALSETHDIAVLVGQNLKLDVPRILDVLLHVEVAIAERSRRFRLRRLEQSRQFFFVADDAHAAPAAAGRGLHNHREADLLRPLDRFALGGDDSIRTRQDRHTCLLHRSASFFLLAHQAHDFRPRADELDLAHLADFGEVGVFGQ